jgi:hypothetical protein
MTRIGGYLRWEEHRLSRTRVCVDREGDVDDLSEEFIRLIPPSSGTAGGAHEPRLGRHDLTSAG